MQPDSASAVMITVIGIRNVRATRTGAIPQSETAIVMQRVWLTKGFLVMGEGERRHFLAALFTGRRIPEIPAPLTRIASQANLSPQAGRGLRSGGHADA